MGVLKHHLPGGEWLYYKLYTQPNNSDTILLVLYPIIRELEEDRLIELFFFVRYNDPSFHLRLRFKCTNQAVVTAALKNVINDLFESQLIYNVSIDSYHREVERYGGDLILVAEHIFSTDSLHILEMLELLDKKGHLDTDDRWLSALLLIDDTLDGFGLSLDRRRALMSVLSESFKSEYKFFTHRYVRQIDDKYRAQKQSIYHYFEKNIDNKLILLLRERGECIKRILVGGSIREEILLDYVASIVHMSMNRWFKTQGRLYELFLYSFLGKYYTTEKIRNGAHHYINH